jgi:hypothetical protein
VVLVTTVVSTYATHGAYVTAMGGGDDAARSCIGMPIVAQPQNIGPTREEVVRADDLFFLPNGFGASAARIAAPSPRRRP